MKRKVYCNDCKYFYVSDWDAECESPHNLKDVDTPVSVVTRHRSDYKRLNQFNNCTYYKRKWWKFWIVYH